MAHDEHTFLEHVRDYGGIIVGALGGIVTAWCATWNRYVRLVGRLTAVENKLAAAEKNITSVDTSATHRMDTLASAIDAIIQWQDKHDESYTDLMHMLGRIETDIGWIKAEMEAGGFFRRRMS